MRSGPWTADCARDTTRRRQSRRAARAASSGIMCVHGLCALGDLDKARQGMVDTEVERLLQEAFAFRWEPLQPAADAFADDVLQQMPEYVHKLLGGIATRDESMMAFAVGELAHFVTVAVATQRGMLVVSHNTRYRQLWEELGLESAWTAAHAAAVGAAALEHTPLLG